MRLSILLPVVLVMVVSLSFSAHGLSISEGDNTTLMLWDDTDSGIRYTFENVRFYANFTTLNETGDAIQVPETVCKIRDNYQGSISDLVGMTETNGIFQFTKSFNKAGTYQFEVECDSDLENLSFSESFTVSAYPNKVCGLDVFGLTVENSRVKATVENTGNWYEEVEYTLEAGDSELMDTKAVLAAGEKISIDVYHPFPYGDTVVKLSASADCGSADSEQMTRSILEPYSCFYPYGLEGENRCDRTNKQVLVCSNGDWETDGTLEYLYECASDWEANILRNYCATEFTNDYRCFEGDEQRAWRNRDCTLTWKTVEECEHGCSGSRCIKLCGVDAEISDYSDNIVAGEHAEVTVTTENTGEGFESITLDFYFDGVKKGYAVLDLASGEKDTRTFGFTPATASWHEAKVIANTDCGSTDTEKVTISIFQPIEVVIAQEVDQVEEKLETLVGISPNKLDIEVGKGKMVRIDIETEQPQTFSIEATGMAEDWLSFEDTVFIERVSTQYIYVAPKEVGPQTLDIKVTALDEGKVFTENVFIYGAQSSEPTDWVTTTEKKVKNTIYFAMAEPGTIISLVLAIFLVTVVIGAVRLREPGVWDDE